MSKTLLEAAGDEIQKECYTQFPNGFGLNDIAITTAGKIKNLIVFHVLVTSQPDDQAKINVNFNFLLYKII